MKIKLKQANFFKLQGFYSETEMAEKIGVSREQLWRIKKGRSPVGKNFISKFRKAFPNESVDDYFEFVGAQEYAQE